MTHLFRRQRTLPLTGLFVLLLALAGAARAAMFPDFTQIVKDNGNAIVNISTTQEVKPGDQSDGEEQQFPQLPPDSPFNQFFKRFFQQQGPYSNQPHEVRSLGSGFIIDSNGYILTNAHVVNHADHILVRLNDRRELPAKLVGMDKRSDVALLKINATGLQTVKIGDSSKLEVGQWVLAIGSPFGFDHTATQGIISALHRSLPDDTYVPFIQTDVPVNPGNSGGPLFNTEGQVVGINSQIYTNTGGYMGLSFAIPINVVMRVAHELRTTGHVIRGWLGVEIQSVNQDLAQAFKMQEPAGALVASVVPDSPAAHAGVKTGDIILSYDGQKVEESSQLPPMVATTPIGKVVTVEVLRNGTKKDLHVKIARLTDNDVAEANTTTEHHALLNMAVANMSRDERKSMGIGDRGVMVKQVGAGPAADAGVRPGDVILAIEGHDIHDVTQLRALVHRLPKGKPVPMLIQRGNGPLFLVIKIPPKG